jgi:hypothetical protein
MRQTTLDTLHATLAAHYTKRSPKRVVSALALVLTRANKSWQARAQKESTELLDDKRV